MNEAPEASSSTVPSPEVGPETQPGVETTAPPLDDLVEALKPTQAETAASVAALTPAEPLPPVTPPPPPEPAAPVLTPEEELAAAKLAEQKAEWAIARLAMVGDLDKRRAALFALEYPATLPEDPVDIELAKLAAWCQSRTTDVRVSGNTWIDARGLATIVTQRMHRK